MPLLLLLATHHGSSHTWIVAIVAILIHMEHALTHLRTSFYSNELINTATILHDEVLLLLLAISSRLHLTLVRLLLGSKGVLSCGSHRLFLLGHLAQLIISLLDLLKLDL